MSKVAVKQLWENTNQRTVLLLALAVSPILALSIAKFDGLFVFVAIAALVSATMAFLWPELATVSVTFALFANLPAIATRFHGVPQVLSMSIVLLLLLPFIDYLVRKKEKIILEQTTRLIVLLAAVFTLSGIFALDFSVSLVYVLGLLSEGLLLFWLFLNVVRSRTTMNRVISTLLITGALLGSLAVYQRFTGFSTDFGGLAQSHASRGVGLSDEEVEDSDGGGANRTEGPVGETNRFAQIMLVLLPLALFKIRFSESKLVRYLTVIGALLILSAMALTYSRGAFLNLILLVGLAALLGEISMRKLMMGGILLVILVLLVAPAYVGRIQSIAGVKGIVSTRGDTEVDGSIKGRMTEMLSAFNAFLDHPILGVGPGHYMAFYSIEYHRSIESAFRFIPVKRRAHNLYLEIAAETGILGLGVFMAILVTLVFRLAKARKFWKEKNPEYAGLATAFMFSILAYMGTGVFLHLAYQRYFWLLLALGAAAARILQVEASALKSEPEPSPTSG